MGMKHLPKRSGEYLCEIIMCRHELTSTTDDIEQTAVRLGCKLIGDVPAATAILNRFLQAAELVEITGRSFRLKNGGRTNDDEKKEEEHEKVGRIRFSSRR